MSLPDPRSGLRPGSAFPPGPAAGGRGRSSPPSPGAPPFDARATRRAFLRRAAGLGAALSALRAPLGAAPRLAAREALGPLVTDAARILDLPAGFEYRVLSRAGETMDDGHAVPPRHDGMAAFAGEGGRTVLVRNHENALGPPAAGAPELPAEKVYDLAAGDVACLGGTTTLVYDTQAQRLERHWLSLAGTLVNCAGGPTPWGSWISCEETVARANAVLKQDHGWCFEVPAGAEGLADPRPLRGLGRFRHEAVAVDPASGCVYLTEDVFDGLVYRFVPDVPGDLHAGGKLQALAVREAPSLDTRNWHALTHVPAGRGLEVEWIDLEQVDSPEDDLRRRGFAAGAARFARGEGVHYAGGAVWFCCTSGGGAKLGQVWRYVPSAFEGTLKEERERPRLELYFEPADASLMENCDNLCAAPFGHLVVCEDGPGKDRLLGVAPSGTVYELGRNATGDGELAGATFAPDGSTLFVNAQDAGLTLAVTGPWERAQAVG